jgi:hypothetical protein
MQPVSALTPEEKADFALLKQANERGGFVIEVGANKHQALQSRDRERVGSPGRDRPQECEAASRVQAHGLRPLALMSSEPCVAAAA